MKPFIFAGNLEASQWKMTNAFYIQTYVFSPEQFIDFGSRISNMFLAYKKTNVGIEWNRHECLVNDVILSNREQVQSSPDAIKIPLPSSHPVEMLPLSIWPGCETLFPSAKGGVEFYLLGEVKHLFLVKQDEGWSSVAVSGKMDVSD